jgi:hypothetical protein
MAAPDLQTALRIAVDNLCSGWPAAAVAAPTSPKAVTSRQVEYDAVDKQPDRTVTTTFGRGDSKVLAVIGWLCRPAAVLVTALGVTCTLSATSVAFLEGMSYTVFKDAWLFMGYTIVIGSAFKYTGKWLRGDSLYHHRR